MVSVLLNHLFVGFNMADNVYVSVTGPALSFLLYENVKSFGDQEGFLLGEIVKHVTDTISDSQIRSEKTETVISVSALMPMPSSLCFYNGVGKLDNDVLQKFVKNKRNEIVGWYSFRRNSVLHPHLRQKLVYKELCTAMDHIPSEHFVFCLLNTSISLGGSTHVFRHKFLRCRHKMLEPLHVRIHNLGEAPQSEYKLAPSSACLSESFISIISTLNDKCERSSDLGLMCHIQEALQDHLRQLVKDVVDSEMRIADLEKKVATLKAQKGPISNEILLPQILKEEEVPVSLPPVTTNIQVDAENNIKAEINHVVEPPTKDKHEVVSHKDPTVDAFAFVNEVKLQMSQPQKVVSERGARRGGIARGAGRGITKTQQFQQQTRVMTPSSSPHTRLNAEQITLHSAASGPALRNATPSPIGVKTRAKCAQINKKPTKVNQTIAANGSPDDLQES